MKITIDACTLIYLAKAGLLDFLKRLPYEHIIDKEVYNESVVKGMEEGYPDAYLIKYFIEKQKIIKNRAGVAEPGKAPALRQTRARKLVALSPRGFKSRPRRQKSSSSKTRGP